MRMTWLPPVTDLAPRLKAARQATGEEAWRLLARIAEQDLSFLETLQVDKLLQEKFGKEPPPSLTTAPVRLALLGSCTVEQLLPGIRVGALRRGLWVGTHLVDYGQGPQALMGGDQALEAFRPTDLLFIMDAHDLFGNRPLDAEADPGTKVREAIEKAVSLWRLARERFQCRIHHQVPLNLFPPVMGSNEQRAPASLRHLLSSFIERLRPLADAQKADLLDLGPWVERFGSEAWHDPVLWHKAKQEVSPAAGPFYGELVSRLLGARLGRSRKALVLDLDNTLWGGVIGDDGLEGIRLGQGSAVGEAFTAFQEYALALARRGVVLAVCSKNEEGAALEPFDRHPEMVLKRKDIACFVANWGDKAANLKQIAKALNLGLDSLVFVDDNPAERFRVRESLPQVAVPEMPEDPALFTDCLAMAGYFESVELTGDDLARSEQYLQNQQREKAQASFADLDDYLKNLDMTLSWGPFDPLSLPRVAQLVQKTNQFNLTTRRHSQEELARLASDPRSVTLRCRLKDRFGDNGLIGVVIAREGTGGQWDLDTWLMSCRVLGRGVETAMLGLVSSLVKAKGGKELRGAYRPTAKNGMVRDLYPKLGFRPLDPQSGAKGADEENWTLPLDREVPGRHHIRCQEGD